MKKKRLDYGKVAPEGVKGLVEIERYIKNSELDPKICELVKLRASQINGCAYCLDMHTKDARKAGETEQRLYVLSAWRETPFYSKKERVALAWTEALTLIAEKKVEEELYEEVIEQFGEKQTMVLTMTIIAINGWNRLALSFKSKPGSYSPK